jgi:hypothetical protein
MRRRAASTPSPRASSVRGSRADGPRSSMKCGLSARSLGRHGDTRARRLGYGEPAPRAEAADPLSSGGLGAFGEPGAARFGASGVERRAIRARPRVVPSVQRCSTGPRPAVSGGLSRFRGATHLFFDGVDAVTGVVEDSHRAVWDRTVRRLAWFSPLDLPVRAVRDLTAPPSRAVYASIRLGSRVARTLVDLAAITFERRRDDPRRLQISSSTSARAGDGAPAEDGAPDGFDRAQSIVNGVWGCHLSRRAHPLDLGLSLRDPSGRIVALSEAALAEAFPKPTEKVALFLHGSSSTEACWTYRGAHHYGDPRATFGRMLSEELGYTSLFIRYNSGRRIEQNGHELSQALAALFDRWPVEPERVVLVGHSMGGLVARSAARFGRDRGGRMGRASHRHLLSRHSAARRPTRARCASDGADARPDR